MPGYNNTVTCPYNKSHNILRERFQTHLVKCSKSYPNIILKTCPFNTTHLINESDFDVCTVHTTATTKIMFLELIFCLFCFCFQYHVTECEDRANFDLYRFPIAAAAAAPQENRPPAPEPVYVPLPDDGENWDDVSV